MAAAWWRLYEEIEERSHPLRRTNRRYFLLLWWIEEWRRLGGGYMKRMERGVTRYGELTGDISCFLGRLRDGGGYMERVKNGVTR